MSDLIKDEILKLCDDSYRAGSISICHALRHIFNTIKEESGSNKLDTETVLATIQYTEKSIILPFHYKGARE